MNIVNILVFLTFSIFQGAKTYSKYQIRAEREIVAKDGQFPFQALIRLKYGDRYPICNGVILNADYVLTAAGCIKHYLTSVDDLEVVVGGLSVHMIPSSDHVQGSFVRNILVHPTWYITDGNLADIALLQVYPKFRETSFVKWAEIGNMIKSPPSRVIISGWGNADQLAYFSGQVYNVDTCNQLLKDEISSSTFCIGSFTNKKLLSMKKYAGASVGVGNTIYGITSSSKNAVATILSQYKSWIESVIYRYSDDETTEKSSETDYDSEESDETIQPTVQTTHDYSSIYSTGLSRTSTLTQYTTTKYSNTRRTTLFKSSTSPPTTPLDEQTSEESSETDETDNSEESDTRPTRYSPFVYSTTSRTTHFKPSTSPPTTPLDEQTSEESNETDEIDNSEESDTRSTRYSTTSRTTQTSEESNETDETDENNEETSQSDENDTRSTQYTIPEYSTTSRTMTSKSSTSILTTSFDEQTSEESSEIDETEESDETERSTPLYTIPRYSSIYKTTLFRPSIAQSTATFVQETSVESTETSRTEESDEAEKSTQRNNIPTDPYRTNTEFFRSTTPLNELESNETNGTEGYSTKGPMLHTTDDDKHHSTDRTNPLGPSTLYKPTINSEIEESEPSSSTDKVHKAKKTNEILVINVNATTAANEFHSNNGSNDSYSEPISSVSVKFNPSYFTSILFLFYFSFLTKNLL